MTNETDDLRDRIENTLAQAGARGKDKAQAVIDDLHLMHYEFTNHDGTRRQHVHGWWEE